MAGGSPGRGISPAHWLALAAAALLLLLANTPLLDVLLSFGDSAQPVSTAVAAPPAPEG
ncbi:MAG: hypothetical protein HXY24_19245 [Rubrivivax sp.]|nr:hypothetical protein [Rubrivivax sp.]